MSSIRGATEPETFSIRKRRRLTEDSEIAGTIEHEEHTIKLHTGFYIEPIATARKCLVPVWDDNVSMTAENDEEEEEYGGEEDSVKEDRVEGPDAIEEQQENEEGTMISEFESSFSVLIDWARSVKDAGFPAEEVPARTYADVAVQTGDCGDVTDVNNKALARTHESEKGYMELRSDIKFAERAAKTGWSKYWDSEVQRLELQRSEKILKNERAQARRDLDNTRQDKVRAAEEAAFWRQKYADIGREYFAMGNDTFGQ
ncbi:hypothetical protein K435DRAFT_865786 [Dendrothele bispora CBS 962.96]|uniref:Uncharacterized protein n=1 Tax=Dendrothele bispora (strain CBS 962.96) TaxID=1314807 RepID=A0A4S8LIH1_DENBC|nr:hypothetical protein K435DRAFT_865786 [Dendrothele bispora CBS 962.96]